VRTVHQGIEPHQHVLSGDHSVYTDILLGYVS